MDENPKKVATHYVKNGSDSGDAKTDDAYTRGREASIIEDVEKAISTLKNKKLVGIGWHNSKPGQNILTPLFSA